MSKKANKMTDFPEIIKDGDIELRRVAPTFELAKELLEIVDRNRARLARWLPWVDGIKTPEDEYGGLKHIYEKEWAYFIFQNGKIVGSVGFVERDEKSKSLEIGYWLDQAVSGRGIMTRVVKMLEDMVFGLGNEWNRIQIKCDALNEKSQNVAKRCGYVYEGILRQSCPYNDGSLGDSMVFSKLKSEWQKNA
jgi:RimJ/RimL family protein N-acetyltransferase